MQKEAKDSVFFRKSVINCKGKLLDISKPLVMGILNVTPDSFYDGGKNNNVVQAIAKAEEMLLDGATIIDIGGYSSRPNADDISIEEEKKRVLPIISELVKQFPDIIISVDTFRSEVAYAAINEGAAIINDISGGELDKNMFDVVAKLGVPYILMHMKGNPQNMVNQTNYDDVLKEMHLYFSAKINELYSLGVNDIILDPGFGFSKTAEQSFYILNNLKSFDIYNLPILAGMSRKSMIYKTLDVIADKALNGTTALNMAALINGAKILRVHDVKEAMEVTKLYAKLSLA